MFLATSLFQIAELSSNTTSHDQNKTSALLISGPSSMYSVTFHETGLPAGMQWSVQLGSSYADGNGSSIVLNEPNGTYSYYVFNSGIFPSIFSGTVEISGSSVTVNVAFHALSIDETGGDAGFQWDISIQNKSGFTFPQLSFSNVYSGNVTFYLANGNYSYGIEVVENAFESSYYLAEGYALINDSPVTVNFDLYKLSFSETGLSANSTDWFVSATNSETGQNFAFASHIPILYMYVPSGNYTYSGYVYDSYSSSYKYFDSGYLNTSISTTESPFAFYTAKFTETGVPAGATWAIDVLNLNTSFAFGYESITNSIIMYLTPGTYEYVTSIFSQGNIQTYVNSSNPLVNVSSNTSINVAFNGIYNVTFIESGLPLDQNYWYVHVLSPSQTFDVASGNLSLYLQSGSYQYMVGYNNNPNNYEIDFTTVYSFNLNNADLGRQVNFYPLTFTETVPSIQIGWTIQLYNSSNDATIGVVNIVNPSFTFFVLPGEYNYSFYADETQTGSYPSNLLTNLTTPGNVTITNSGETQDVGFALARGYYLAELDFLFSVPGLSDFQIHSLYMRNTTGYYVAIDYLDFPNPNEHNVTYIVQNGSFSYSFFVGYPVYQSFNHQFVVNGSNLVLSVNVSSPKITDYQFWEYGLPAGDTWSVTINGSVTHTSSTPVIDFALQSIFETQTDIYRFTVAGPSGYNPDPNSGALAISYDINKYNISFTANDSQNLGVTTSTLNTATGYDHHGNYLNSYFYDYYNYLYPSNFVYDPSTNLLYFGSYSYFYGAYDVQVYNLSSGLTYTVALPYNDGQVYSLALDTGNGKVYYADDGDYGNLIGIVNANTSDGYQSVHNYAMSIDQLVYDPYSNTLYAYSGYTGDIYQINPTTLQPMKNVSVGYSVYSLISDPANGYLLFLNTKYNTLEVINPANGTLTENISIGTRGYTMTYDQNSNTVDILGSQINSTDGAVTPDLVAVSTSSWTVATDVKLSEFGNSIIYDPANNNLYISASFNSISTVYPGYGNLLAYGADSYSFLGTISVAPDPASMMIIPGVNELVVSSYDQPTINVVALHAASSAASSPVLLYGSIGAAAVITGLALFYFIYYRPRTGGPSK